MFLWKFYPFGQLRCDMGPRHPGSQAKLAAEHAAVDHDVVEWNYVSRSPKLYVCMYIQI